MCLTKDHYTKEYVKSVKEGKITIKPNHIKSEEREISNWLETGGDIPQELDQIQGQVAWDKELGSPTQSFMPSGSSLIPYLLTGGFVLGLTGLFVPTLAPVAVTGWNVAKFGAITAGTYVFERFILKV